MSVQKRVVIKPNFLKEEIAKLCNEKDDRIRKVMEEMTLLKSNQSKYLTTTAQKEKMLAQKFMQIQQRNNLLQSELDSYKKKAQNFENTMKMKSEFETQRKLASSSNFPINENENDEEIVLKRKNPAKRKKSNKKETETANNNFFEEERQKWLLQNTNK